MKILDTKFVKSFLTALKFLTCLPVKISKEDPDSSELSDSVVFFPIVGLVLGLILVICNFVFSIFLPAALVKIFLIGILVLITGGLHIDGLSDTVDALFSGKNKDRALEIMKESTVGPMGVVAIFGSLAIKYVVLLGLSGPGLYAVLLLFPVMGRIAMVIACWLFPYARSEGTAKVFVGNVNVRKVQIAILVTLIISFILQGFRGLMILGYVILATVLLGKYFVKKYDGITGDILGFINEVGEIVALLGATIVIF